MQGAQLVGYAGTLTIGGTNIIPQVATDLIVLDAVSNPIYSLSAKLGQVEDCWNPLYQWQEIQLDEPGVNCETAVTTHTAAATFTVVLDSLSCKTADQYLESTTNQIFEIQSVTSTDTNAGTSTVVVQKEPASQSTLAFGVNSYWISLGNSMLEGGVYADPVTRVPARLSNTITQRSESVSISHLAEWIQTYYGSQYQLDIRATQQRFLRDNERTILWGQQYEQSQTRTRQGFSDSGVARGTQGIWNTIQSKRIPYTGVLTEETLDTVLSGPVFGDIFGGGAVKLGFSGNLVFKDVATFVKNKFRKLDSMGTYGLQMYEYTSPVGNGTLYFVEERQFFPSTVSGPNPFSNTILGIDPAWFRLMKMGPALMKVIATDPPERSRKSIAFETWFGNKCMNERSHFLLSHIV